MADLHPSGLFVNSTGSIVFSLSRDAIASSEEFRELTRLAWRSNWFVDVVVELVVRKSAHDFHRHLAEVCPDAYRKAIMKWTNVQPAVSKEYCDGTVRFWFPMSRLAFSSQVVTPSCHP